MLDTTLVRRERRRALGPTAAGQDQASLCPIQSAALKIFVHHPKKTFATWGNSGIEPDKGKGISSPGKYEASLMWPRNDGERQWSTMSDWTCR
jgi:hypothetical protein